MKKELDELDVKYLIDLSLRCENKNTNYNDCCKIKIIATKISELFSKKENKKNWNIQLMYKLSYSQPRFENLGTIQTELYEDALKIAEDTAKKFLEEMHEEKHIENWEVKIRP